MAAKSKKIQVPEGPLTVDQATAVALEAVGAPMLGPHHGRTRKALRLYLAGRPQEKRAACDAEELAVAQQDAANARRLFELTRQIKEKIQATRLEVWELEVEARRLGATGGDSATGTRRPLNTTAMWRTAIVPRPAPSEELPERGPALMIYPGGHEGWVKRGFTGGSGSHEDNHVAAVSHYDVLPSGWLTSDNSEVRKVTVRKEALKKRRAALTLARAVAFTPSLPDVTLEGYVERLGPQTMTLATCEPNAVGLASGMYTERDNGLFVRRTAYGRPPSVEICAWATRALHWLEQNNLAMRLVDDQAELPVEEPS